MVINDEETEKYVGDMNSGRSPGSGNVLIKHVKYGGTEILLITKLF